METIQHNTASEDLFYAESDCLERFRQKAQAGQVGASDINCFSDKFAQLISETQAITQITDDLQKSLDRANNQIEDKSQEIARQNQELENTIKELAHARVSQRSSIVLMVSAFLFFMLEELLIQDMVHSYMAGWFGLGAHSFMGTMAILVVVFIVVKFFEGFAERYFLVQEKKKILARKVVPAF